jgi:alpha-L-rhamnosidase
MPLLQKTLLRATLLASPLLIALTAAATPVQLRTEHLINPLGIDALKPQFAWQSDATTPDWTQSAYQILVATNEKDLTTGKPDVWDSGRVASSDSINIVYAGPALKPQTRYVWLVRVWDDKQKNSTSTPAFFETGLLSPSDWHAQWIRRADPVAERELAAVRWLWLPDSNPQQVAAGTTAEFRYTLHLDAAPIRASLHVVSPGGYVVTVNGVVTGQHKAWGAFDWEEIGPLLKLGDNEILAKVVAEAKVAAPVVSTAFAASLRITVANGPRSEVERRIPTDSTWQVRADSTAPWQPAHEIGPITTPLSIGIDRHSAVPGPDRIATAAAILRKAFTVASVVQSARLTITALGAYQAFLNGKPIAPHNLLDPGFTDFHKRVLYQTYDVTPLIANGNNTITAILGGGWHSSPMTWAGSRAYTEPDALRAQLDITLADGTHKTVATDETWQTAPAPTLFSEIYAGEVYDARFEANWTNAVVEKISPEVQLTAQPNLSIAVSNTLHPIAMSPANEAHPIVYDMGQNMVGNIVLHVHGPRGTLVRMRFAERLNPDGSLYTENLRNATVTDTYILSGNGDETYTPAFTFHGFRYVELTGYPGTPPPASKASSTTASRPRPPSAFTVPANSSTAWANSVSGASAATSSPSPPTVRSATNASVGWATPASSGAPAPTTSTSPASPASSCSTSTTPRPRRTPSPTSRPTSSALSREHPAGPTPASSFPTPRGYSTETSPSSNPLGPTCSATWISSSPLTPTTSAATSSATTTATGSPPTRTPPKTSSPPPIGPSSHATCARCP